jgi:hypothetical protein
MKHPINKMNRIPPITVEPIVSSVWGGVDRISCTSSLLIMLSSFAFNIMISTP